jgi:carboxyl-terminal processing protease
MNTLKRFLGSVVLLVVVCGCDSVMFAPDPENTPESNFEIFWADFDRYYAQFALRHIDWDSVYALHRPQVSLSTSERQLFAIFSSIVLGINDMHVNLYTPLGDVSWKSGHPSAYPSMRIINAGKYIQSGPPQNTVIGYRTCQDPTIGYLYIGTFVGEGDGLSLADSRYLLIDDILSRWKDMKGIIIDVRWNGGGNSVNAENVAGRFADASRVYAYYSQKVGPGRNAFSAWKGRSIEPRGSYQFQKAVVVLTSRATSSAAEMFVLAMQVLPNVTVVGDTTGGGVGNAIFRELPNGWSYRLSTEMEADAQGRIIEGVGVYPDIMVRTTVADSANGIDRMMETAIEIIKHS